MKKFTFIAVAAVLLTFSSCSKKYTETFAPEERALNMMKITNEANNNVVGVAIYGGMPRRFVATDFGGNKKAGMHWGTARRLSISPDGTELAFLNYANKQTNVMIRSAFSQAASTQRTTRNVYDFSWGDDGKIYFSDHPDNENWQISAVDSHLGNLVRQMTSNNIDANPVVSTDGKVLFFTRIDKSGPSVWSYNIETGALTNCAIGYNPCVIAGNNNQFICVRNSTAGNSEIWLVDYVLGQETAILSDVNTSYTNPDVSPDGRWIVCQGNAKSNITKKNNLDIFAVRMDGTSKTQLTYHPYTDCCPVFSKDGNYIYFLSRRANKDDYFNVWRMPFKGM